jgi:NAD(P)H-dependent FMN reductase
VATGKGSILVISGTNRPESNTAVLARVVHAMYQQTGIAADYYSLCDLPRELFDPSAYKHKPESFLVVQQRIVDARGLHVIVAEYNGSFPGVLKYFIDMLRFPDSFQHKPVALVGVSNGSWGGLRPVEQLQMVFGYRNAYIFPERVFIAGARHKVADGRLLDAEVAERLERQIRGFADFAGCMAEIDRRREGT